MNMNDIIAKVKNDAVISRIVDYSQKYSDDLEIYLVGGAIRDFYLNSENLDKDIVVTGIDVQDFAQKLANEINATFIALDDENKIYRLVLKDKINFIDIAALIGKNIEEDLKRRDLTINSIALNLNSSEIIDVNGAIPDLKMKKLRHISEQNFIDDPLRLLRVYRFRAVLGFDIDVDLSRIVEKHSLKIHQVAHERINYELLKMFSGSYTEMALLEMNETKLLKEIFPVVEDLKKVPPNLHHHLDLFMHSVEIVKQIQELYEQSCPEVQAHLNKVAFGGMSRLAHLKLAGFLHDIGKPSTWTIEEDTGKHRFIKHDDVGSKMSINFFKSAKFSKKQVDYIAKMIKYHIYPSHVISSPDINDKIYMRFVRKMKDEAIDVIILAMADRLSARGVEITDAVIKRNINGLQALLDFYLNIKDSLKPLPKLLSGEDIMDLLNLKPSKELGNIIKALQEAQLAGDVVTRDEAVNFVKAL